MLLFWRLEFLFASSRERELCFYIMISAPRRCLGILVVPLLVTCGLALCVVCGSFDGCGGWLPCGAVIAG